MVKMLDRKLLRDVWQLRGQVLAIALVVAAGITGYCGALSTYDSLRWLQASYYERARYAHVFVQGKRAPLPVADRLLEIEGVAELETTVMFDTLIDLDGSVAPLTGRMIALPLQGRPRINRLTLTRGAWVDAPRSNQVLVNQTFAEAHHLEPGSHVTALLNGKRETLQVVGIVLSAEYIFPARGGIGDEKTFGIFWVDHERLAYAFNMEGAFNSVAVRLAHGASEPAVIAALDRELDRYGFTGAYGRADAISHKILTQEIDQWKVYGTILPVVILAVSVFLLNVALSRQIGTQRSQIAALKALGCDDREIGLHYLKFVLVIVLIGGPIGVAGGYYFGYEVTQLYAEFFRFPDFEYRMLAWVPLSAIVISMAAASAGAVHALRRVVRLPPAEAMHPPAPPVYRPTLGERLGIGRLYSPAFRMIARDIERRPLRAVLTVFGIAAAVAILIAGTWWSDALDYLLDIEVRMRDRQEVTIALIEPSSSTTLYDFERLPGVLRAEPDRDVLVRISNGPRSYRTSLSGIPRDGQMRPFLDEALQIRPLPSEGIVLNDYLAQHVLGVVRGDVVRVQVLQGNRAEGVFPVVAFSHELMQLPATMDREALNRFLGEGDALTGARLFIDRGMREALMHAIRETPRIAVAAEIGPIIRNVRETSARNILFFTSVMSVIAAAIALGVVYNNARIALAERAWDLASLRVLGFTRGEVSTLLLGELAVELLLALPIGCVLGNWLAWGMLQQMQTEMRLPFLISPRTYALACLVVIGAGVASALVVRRRIDQLDLVAVLKTRE